MAQVTDPVTGQTRQIDVGPTNELTLASSPTGGPSISGADIDLGQLQQAPPMASHVPVAPLPSHVQNQPLSPVDTAKARDAAQTMRAATPVERANNAILGTYDALEQGVMQAPIVGPALRAAGMDPAGMVQSFLDPTQTMAAPLPVVPLAESFYSRLDKDLLNAVKVPSHPNRIKTLIKNVASQEEADYRGLTAWLDAKKDEKVTPQQLQHFLQTHPHGVGEIRLGHSREIDTYDEDIAALRHKRDTRGLSHEESLHLFDLEDAADRLRTQSGSAHWDREDVNLPGGEKYREYVFTLPEREPETAIQPRALSFDYDGPEDKQYMSTAMPSKIDNGPHPAREWTVTVRKPGNGVLVDSQSQGRIVEWTPLGGDQTHVSPVLDEWRFQVNHPQHQNAWYRSLDEAKTKFETAMRDSEQETAARQHYSAKRQLNYTSGHWSGITNPVAHLRMDDRITVNGEPAAFIQEGQSDWHQAGRESGYRDQTVSHEQIMAAHEKARATANALSSVGNEMIAAADRAGIKVPGSARNGEVWARDNFAGLHDAFDKIDDAIQRDVPSMSPSERSQRTEDLHGAVHDFRIRYAEAKNARDIHARLSAGQSGVPDAPFKDTGWQRLAFNRALVDAVDADKDWLLWTPGDMQAARYDNLLSGIQSLEATTWEDGSGNLVARGDFGKRMFDFDDRKGMESIIGPAATERLLASKQGSGGPTGWLPDDVPQSAHAYYRLDTSDKPLKITSAGMVQQYDVNFVNIAKKIGAQYGATVEKVKIHNAEPGVSVDVHTKGRLGEEAYSVHVNGRSSIADRYADQARHFATRAEAQAYAKKLRAQVKRDTAHEVWGLKLTPELKAAIKGKGVTLMEHGPGSPAVTAPKTITPEGWQKLVKDHPAHLHQALADLHTRLHEQSFLQGEPHETMHTLNGQTGEPIGDMLGGTRDQVLVSEEVMDQWGAAPSAITAHTHPESSTFSSADLTAHNRMITHHKMQLDAMLVFGQDGSWYELRWPSKPLTSAQLSGAVRAYDRLIYNAIDRSREQVDKWFATRYNLQTKSDPMYGTLFRPRGSSELWTPRKDMFAKYPEGKAQFDRFFRDEAAGIWHAVAHEIGGRYRYHLAP